MLFVMVCNKTNSTNFNSNLICCYDDYGPWFGWSALGIGDRCDVKVSSTAYGIGGSYNVEGPNKYTWNSQETWTTTTGATE